MLPASGVTRTLCSDNTGVVLKVYHLAYVMLFQLRSDVLHEATGDHSITFPYISLWSSA
ncbi:MAG: hypothetical protein MZV63_23040 [Marinilabiliales bacterium]|nr:hypothetical protein [Marinilabiliales bacterium]